MAQQNINLVSLVKIQKLMEEADNYKKQIQAKNLDLVNLKLYHYRLCEESKNMAREDAIRRQPMANEVYNEITTLEGQIFDLTLHKSRVEREIKELSETSL